MVEKFVGRRRGALRPMFHGKVLLSLSTLKRRFFDPNAGVIAPMFNFKLYHCVEAMKFSSAASITVTPLNIDMALTRGRGRVRADKIYI